VIQAGEKKDVQAKKRADRRRAGRRRSNTAKVAMRVAKFEADHAVEHAALLEKMTELNANKLALAVAEAEAVASTAAAAGLDEKAEALRRTNKDLIERVLHLEDTVVQLEDSLAEAEAVGDQSDADDVVRVKGSDRKHVIERQHTFRTRLVSLHCRLTAHSLSLSPVFLARGVPATRHSHVLSCQHPLRPGSP
jgi:hypothetical protein